MLHICGRAARSILLPLNERDVSLKLTCSNFSSQVCHCSPPKIVLTKTARYRDNFENEPRAISTGCTKGDVGSTFLVEMPLECGYSWASWTGSTYCRSYVFDFPLFYISLPPSVSPLSIFSLRAQSRISIFLFNFCTFHSLSSCFITVLFSFYAIYIVSVLLYYFFNLDILFR